MKRTFRFILIGILLGLLSVAAFAADGPQVMSISCEHPNPEAQNGLHRVKGDSDMWTFQIALEGNAHFVTGPFWDYPGKGGNDPDWGLWTGGEDGTSSLGWSSPEKTSSFSVGVHGQIACGNGGGGAPIDFAASWSGEVVSVIIKRDGVDITEPQDNPQEVKVGEIMKLTAEVQNAPENANIKYQWMVPGVIVKDWKHSVSSSEVVPVDNLTEPALDFAWIDGGDARQVVVAVTVDEVTVPSVTAIFNVNRPIYNLYITQAGDIRFSSYGVDGSFILQDGNSNAVPGVVIAMTNVPAEDAANCNFWQIVTGAHIKKNTASGWMHLRNTGSEFTLDTHDPYGKDPVLGHYATSDSPGAVVAPTDTELSIEDSFSHFLMYRPPGVEHISSIWVPLATANWSWAGHVVKHGTNWDSTDLVSSTLPSSTSGTGTTTYPGGAGWTNNIYPPIWDSGQE